MHEAPSHPTDPIRWHLAIAAIFAVLCAIRLAMPSALFFDEVHYLPAVRTLIDLSVAQNMEHPPLGKQLIAAGVLVFGDNAIGWRVPSMVFGILAVFAGMRDCGSSRAAAGRAYSPACFSSQGFRCWCRRGSPCSISSWRVS